MAAQVSGDGDNLARTHAIDRARWAQSIIARARAKGPLCTRGDVNGRLMNANERCTSASKAAIAAAIAAAAAAADAKAANAKDALVSVDLITLRA